MRGYIYVLISQERPSVVKIGRTSKSPAIRCKEHNNDCYLSLNTWEVHYWRWVENCIASESKIHSLLRNHRLEVKLYKEAFKISLPVAMDAVVRVCDMYPAKSDKQEKTLSRNKKIKLDFLAYEHVKKNGSLKDYILKNRQDMIDEDFYGWLEAIKDNLIT